MTTTSTPGNVKRALLLALYDVYEGLVHPTMFACERACYACCTHNVLATTVEMDFISDYLAQMERPDLVARFQQDAQGTRMRPRVTINALADYCLRRVDPPEPIHEFDMGACPLHDADGCPVYPARPFSCRSLWSKERCAVGGEAVPEPVLVTLNGVFEQLIEDLDVGGLSGNMIDVFIQLSDPRVREAYQAGRPLEPTDHLLANRPNPGLLVPVEHRAVAIHALHVLDKREIQGLPFRQAVKALRDSL